LLLHSSYLPLGVPNGLVIHHAQGLPDAFIAIRGIEGNLEKIQAIINMQPLKTL
jgi:hypothetical protein